MTLGEKKQALAQAEWEQFQQVQNEGGRASCQDDPETFFRMRLAQFSSWPEELVDAYAADLKSAKEEGRLLPAEKYAWMMEHTAPAQFDRIAHLLPKPTELSLRLLDLIVDIQLGWMEEYRKAYPALAAGNRPLRAENDTPAVTSFETYLRGELHTYSENTLLLYLEHLKNLQKQGENLTFLIMEAMVKSYGYRSLEQAERQARERG